MQELGPRAGRGAVLVFTPRYLSDPGERTHTPFRVLPILGALSRAGWRVLFLDEAVTPDPWTRLREALPEVSWAVGWLSETNPKAQGPGILRLAAECRAIAPRVPVVAGGGFLQKLPARFFGEYTELDAIVMGHGEEIVVALGETLERGDFPGSVGGLLLPVDGAFVERPGEITSSSNAEHRARDLLSIDLTPYILDGGPFHNGQPTIMVHGGRGCARECAFCWWWGQDRHRHAPDELAEVVVELKERYGVEQFHVADLDYLDRPHETVAFARRLIQLEARILWGTHASPQDVEELDDGELDLLRESGLALMSLGADSGSEAVLGRLGKRQRPAHALAAARRFAERGIPTIHDVLFGAPGERAEERRKSLQLIEELRAVSPTTFVMGRLFEPQPGTPLGDEVLEGFPAYPKSVSELVQHRRDYRHHRTMVWLDEADERCVKSLVLHDLPLALFGVEGRNHFARAVSRWATRRARARIARARPAARWERLLVERCLGGELVRAYDF